MWHGKILHACVPWIYLWKQRVTSKHVRWKIEILFKYQQREHGLSNYQKRKYNTCSYGIIPAAIKFAYKLSSTANYLIQHHPGVRPAVKSPILYTCVVISRERASVLRYVFIYGDEIFTDQRIRHNFPLTLVQRRRFDFWDCTKQQIREWISGSHTKRSKLNNGESKSWEIDR